MNKWTVLYVSDAKPEPTKGFNKEYGFHINRPFHIVSTLQTGRFVDVIGNKLVIKTQNGFDSQEWTFDWPSRSIINKKSK